MAGNLDPAAFDAVDSSDPEYFIRFLDARGAIDTEQAVKRLIADLLDVRPGHSVLDVGAGTGVDAAELAGRVLPGGRVVGLDISVAMVEEAQRRTADAQLPVEYVEGNAADLRFDDATFDRCRAERVLMATPDPVKAIGEMVRVTRPGGLVVVSEVDAGTLFLNSSDTELAGRLVTGFSDDLVSPWAGRRLHRQFVDAGLEDVAGTPRVVLPPVAFLRILFGNRLLQLVESGETSATDAAAFWAELEEGERAGWLCSGVVCFTVVGRKP